MAIGRSTCRPDGRPSRVALVKLNTNIPLARRRARVIGMQDADVKIVGQFWRSLTWLKASRLRMRQTSDVDLGMPQRADQGKIGGVALRYGWLDKQGSEGPADSHLVRVLK